MPSMPWRPTRTLVFWRSAIPTIRRHTSRKSASPAVIAVFFRVLIMWIYNGSGRSVILVGLFHSAFNITIGNEVMPELLNLPASQTSLMCLGVLAVLAVAGGVFTRGRLAYQGRPAGAAGVAAQPKVR